jgi:predicted O-methyltransferase YrrM
MTVNELIERAWAEGAAVALDGIGRLGRSTAAPDYYRFLSGLCRVVRARRVLEIGTDFGGSILAMRRAIDGADRTLVTVDISDASDEQLAGHPEIVKIRGDCRGAETIGRVIERLSPPIDLLYIDTEHDFENTMASYAIYNSLLAPRHLVFDDITLNDEMRRFWRIMKARYGDHAVNVVEMIPAIRAHPRNPGFGIIVP